jgi:hypothetical protein
VSNVLSEDKRQQVIALGRLGWSLRRIEAAVHIRRETIGGYLRTAGIPVRPPRRLGMAGAGKPGQKGDYRLQLGVGADNGTGTAARTQSFGQRLRGVSRADRAGALTAATII